jgi:hypothetical protein
MPRHCNRLVLSQQAIKRVSANRFADYQGRPVRVLSQSVKNLSVRDNHQPLAVASGFLSVCDRWPDIDDPGRQSEGQLGDMR